MSEEIILPEGYTRVQYLYFDGNSYIRTGVFATNQTGAKIKWSRDKAYGSDDSFGDHLLSCRNVQATNGRWFFPVHSHDGTGWLVAYGNTYDNIVIEDIPLVLGAAYETSLNYLNSETVTINDEIVVSNIDRSIYTENDYCTNSLVLGSFVNNDLNPYNGHNHLGRIYYCKISEGTELIRDFIPCLDNNGVPCMYDLVGGETYYNQGTGKIGYISDPYENNENYSLPAGYTKCLYLQSDGTQYINTSIYKNFEGNDATSTEDGIIPTDETGLYIKAQRLNYGDCAPFGCRGATYGIYPPRINTRGKTIEYRWNNYVQLFTYDKGDDLIYSSSINLYNDRTIHFNSEDTDWDGYITETLSTIGVPVGLFSWNVNGSFNSPWGGRIYRAKITQGTTLIRDFVPCLDASGVPCMYDLVNGYSYYNQGSGSNFEYCIDHQLPSDFIKLKYLEATDSQYINTNYVPQTTDNGDGTYAATTGLYIDAYNITVGDSYPMGCWTTSTASTRFYAHRLLSAPSAVGYGWGAWNHVTTTNGKVAFQSKLNFLNDKKAALEAPIFSTITNTLGNLSFQPTLPIYMFGINQANKLAYNWKGRIYRVKISEGTEIVRDFVPAYDQRLLRPCMYDIVNNVAYYNDGPGEFEYNRDFEGSYTGFAQLGGIGNRIGGTGADGSEYNDFELPSGYTRLGFLESNAGQRIQTSFEASLQQTVKCDFAITDDSPYGWSSVYIAAKNDYQFDITWGKINTEGKTSAIFRHNGPNYIGTGSSWLTINPGQRYSSVINNEGFWLNGVKLATGKGGEGSSGAVYSIFRSVNWSSYCRIYSFVVTDQEELCNYIPALDPTGTTCFFDTVTKQARYNVVETRDFIAGVDTLVQAMALRLPSINKSLTISLPTNDNPTYYEDIIKANNPTWQLTFQYH